MLLLTVFSVLFGYCFIGGASFARHAAVTQAKCERGDCFSPSRAWCSHACISLWLAGIVWPIGLPAFVGMMVGGGRQGLSRDEKRRLKEIAEAEHQAKLARLKADEHAALDRELALMERKKVLSA